MFTTVEGILDKICNQLENNPFGSGDSRDNNNIQNFIMKIRDLQQFRKKFTLIIDDPLSNCFIFPRGSTEENDLSGIIKEEYERTDEQNDQLGLNDMKVDNYEEDNNNKETEKEGENEKK